MFTMMTRLYLKHTKKKKKKHRETETDCRKSIPSKKKTKIAGNQIRKRKTPNTRPPKQCPN